MRSGALVWLCALGCSGSSAMTVRPTADVAALDAAPDVVPVDASDGGESPFDGTWEVVAIECAGVPASPGAVAFITPPNRSFFVVRGADSLYTLSTPTCVQTLRSSVRYPERGSAVFTAAGPWQCEPAGCSPVCGTTPAIPYVYRWAFGEGSLIMSSEGATEDRSCTGFGQSNPITYRYDRRG